MHNASFMSATTEQFHDGPPHARYSMGSGSGFTLIETVMVIVVAAIIVGVYANFFTLGVNVFTTLESSQDINQNKSVIAVRMESEIRQAQGFTLTSATDIQFTSDIDGDGVPETVRYFQSGTDLHKTVNGANDTVIAENAAVSFTGSTSRPIITLTISSDGKTSRIRTSVLRRPALAG